MLFASAPCGVARAATEPVELAYRVDSGIDCPTESEFRRELERRLGEDPFAEAATRTVEVRIDGTRWGPRGSITWQNQDGPLPGVRSFEPRGQSCRELVTNMVFAVTVQLELLKVDLANENTSAATSPPEASGSSQAGGPIDVGLDDGERVTRPEQPDAVDSWGLGAGALLLLGWTPRPVLGARVFAVDRWRALSLEAGAEMTLPGRIERRDGSGFEMSAWSGTLAPCISLAQVAGCVVARFGQTRARGFGLDQSRSPGAFLAQTGLRLVLSQPIAERFVVSAHGEALGNWTPWRVELNRNEVWIAPRVVGAFGLSFTASFL